MGEMYRNILPEFDNLGRSQLNEPVKTVEVSIKLITLVFTCVYYI